MLSSVDQAGLPTYATNISQVSWTCSKFSGRPQITLLLACLSQGEKVVHLDNEDVLSFFIHLCAVSVPLKVELNKKCLWVEQPKLHSFLSSIDENNHSLMGKQ